MFGKGESIMHASTFGFLAFLGAVGMGAALGLFVHVGWLPYEVGVFGAGFIAGLLSGLVAMHSLK